MKQRSIKYVDINILNKLQAVVNLILFAFALGMKPLTHNQRKALKRKNQATNSTNSTGISEFCK